MLFFPFLYDVEAEIVLSFELLVTLIANKEVELL
jgi:hypothetical protein